ncbi:MAG TPA: hypothetical protein VOA87_04555 [Thermoanaerobaculia bacterium]|nr:hypothetical protein [Thermoanaerobaculia bacterium]
MRKAVLGDSCDLVKRFLIHTLRELGGWAVHPMLTENQDIFGRPEIGQYEKLVGVPTISRDVLQVNTPRARYFQRCLDHKGPLLLDPNTGFKLDEGHSVDHLYEADLVLIVRDRSELVMIYDQSLDRRVEPEQALKEKVNRLAQDHHISAMAYKSHACFLFVSGDAQVIDRTRRLLLAAGLPEWRLV